MAPLLVFNILTKCLIFRNYVPVRNVHQEKKKINAIKNREFSSPSFWFYQFLVGSNPMVLDSWEHEGDFNLCQLLIAQGLLGHRDLERHIFICLPFHREINYFLIYFSHFPINLAISTFQCPAKCIWTGRAVQKLCLQYCKFKFLPLATQLSRRKFKLPASEFIYLFLQKTSS